MLTERRVRPRCAFFREKNPESLTLCLGCLLHPENFLVSSPDLEKFSLFFNPTLISRGTLTWSWLLIELTKSRPRHSNDNALAESKNASVVRKHLGYAHIPQAFAQEVNAFCREHLNPYVNFHRPCFFPKTVTDAKGKETLPL